MNLYTAVILQRPDGTVVLVREGQEALWKLPGGQVEDGEEFHVAAVREIQEELGVTVTITPEHSVGYRQGMGNSGVLRTAIVFRRWFPRTVIPFPSSEITEIREVQFTADLPLTDLTRKILSSYFITI